jgi:hypothetical protein
VWTLVGLALGDIPARPWGSEILALVTGMVKVKESAYREVFIRVGRTC